MFSLWLIYPNAQRPFTKPNEIECDPECLDVNCGSYEEALQIQKMVEPVYGYGKICIIEEREHQSLMGVH